MRKIEKMESLVQAAGGEDCGKPKLQFRLLKTSKHHFILSPISLDFIQDLSEALAGAAKLDNKATFYWPKMNETGQTQGYRPVYLVMVSYATIEAIEMVAKGQDSMSVLAGCIEEPAKEEKKPAVKAGSFTQQPEKEVTLAWFKAKLAECRKDPESNFDPKFFADDIIGVSTFTDYKGRKYYDITAESGGFKKKKYACRLYVNPEEPNAFGGETETFYFGNELCVLIYLPTP